ncbi:radical SAM protein [Marivirga sp.]|uniref:radical SAM protein n=1 Tax=Marivirga sp. TaxID=2018662 RepID=UPI003DA6D426
MENTKKSIFEVEKLKLSNYIVNRKVDSNKIIVFSTRSCKSLILNMELFQLLESRHLSGIDNSLLNDLIYKKILVEESENELGKIISENKDHVKNKEGHNGYLYEVLQPSAMCQLGCYYCGQKHRKESVNDDVVDQIINRIYKKYQSHSYKGIYLAWFGAEPLMAFNQMKIIYDRLKNLVDDPTVPIQSKIVTNGLSLKPKIYKELVNKLNVIHIEVTIDGTEEYHDSHRYLKSGNPSFKIIYQNILDIIKSEYWSPRRCKLTIRCNVDEKNYEGVVPLIYKLAQDQIQDKITTLYFVNVFSWAQNEAHKNALTKEMFALKEIEWNLLKHKLGYQNSFILPERKLNTCIATTEDSEMYDVDGNVFNCTEVSYTDVYKNSKYDLGSIINPRNIPKPHNDWWDEVENTKKYPCHTCKLLPVCGGSCPKRWTEGEIACPPSKYNLDKKLEIIYKLGNQNLDIIELINEELDLKDFCRIE